MVNDYWRNSSTLAEHPKENRGEKYAYPKDVGIGCCFNIINTESVSLHIWEDFFPN